MSRWLDILGASVGLVIGAPVLAAAAVAVRLTDGGPALYRQERIGKDGVPFALLKLRTMSVGAEHEGTGLVVSVGDARITRPGRMLRATSLDELPQLWNVLRGDMSLVGPRPTVQSQVSRYSPHQRRRLEVLPGLTGWAQVNGRNSLSWAERIEMDVWYVQHQSIGLDLRILARTPMVLIERDSLYGPDGKTRDFDTTTGEPGMLHIIGAGGFGREAYDAWLAEGAPQSQAVCFVDDHRAGETIRDLPVHSPDAAVSGEFVVGIANAPARKRLAEDFAGRGLVPRTITHPRSVIGPDTTIGVGCVFLAQCHVSSSVTVGDHVQISYNATIGHDAILEDYVTVLPGANVSGSVTLGEGSTVGSGAIVLQGLRVGAGAFIGAGSVVTKDVPANSVVKGVPGRW